MNKMLRQNSCIEILYRAQKYKLKYTNHYYMTFGTIGLMRDHRHSPNKNYFLFHCRVNPHQENIGHKDWTNRSGGIRFDIQSQKTLKYIN